MAEPNVILTFKPSLRRAFFYAFLYASLVLCGRYATNLDRSLNQVWLLSLVVLLLALMYAFLRRATTDYVVNESGVVATWGVIARNTSALMYQRMTNAAARQTVMDRLLGLTSVFFDSAGSPLPEVVFLRITNTDAKRLLAHLREYAQKGMAGPGTPTQVQAEI